MNYEMFLDVVKENLINYFPERYQSWEVIIKRKARINGTRDAIIVRGDRRSGVYPGIYVQDLYEEYQEGYPPFVILQKCANTLTEALDEEMESESIVERAMDVLDSPEDKIVFQLVNSKLNEALLNTVPNRGFLDLSLVYYLDTENGWIRIDNTIAERIGYTEKDLYQAAMENTRKRTPYIIETMRNMILRLLEIPGIDDLSDEEKDEILTSIGVEPERRAIWYLSNTDGCQGITGIVYADVLKELARVTEDDYYVIPSSVHEAVIVRVSDIELETARGLHKDIGKEGNLNPEDYLSNQVYVYHLSTGRLEIAK